MSARRTFRSRVAQRGMTLIEVSVATALSVTVLFAVGYAYMRHTNAQRYSTELAQVQGNGRVALERIGRDIRQAGFVGCNSALTRFATPRVMETSVVFNGTGAGFTITADNAIRAFRGDAADSATTWGGGGAPANAVADSHVIDVKSASLEGATRLSGAIPASGITLPTMGTFEPGRGDDTPTASGRYGLLSDCQGALVISVESLNSTSVTLPATRKIGTVSCGHASRVGSDCVYWPTATLYPIRVVQYYVAEFGTSAAPDRRLMMRKRIMNSDGSIAWNAAQEVMRGVNRLRVIGIGRDVTQPADPTFRAQTNLEEATSVDPLTLLTANDWQRVVRLDLRLQMQAAKALKVGDPAVLRNFESSFSIRARVTADPT
ncbi:MAG: prepilin-type N-terminal cleavage/methylation domain-containing protein [Burkholderiales bacterium]|jgi:type IV pilus assembly protein PilW